MDLLGDIVEKEVDTINNDNNNQHNNDLLNFNIIENVSNNNLDSIQNTGFPELYKPKKISSWKQRLREKKQKQKSTNTQSRKESKPIIIEEKKHELNDIDAINNENLTLLNNMSKDEILNEQKELLESLSPKLIQNLLKNINKRQNELDETPLFAEIEGASGTWIGGENENAKSKNTNLPKLNSKNIELALKGEDLNEINNSNDNNNNTKKHIKFDLNEIEKDDKFEEDDEQEYDNDLDDVAPLDYQMAQSIDHMTNEDLLKDVHFMKKLSINDSKENSNNEMPLDINDPNFNEKLHEKFFPDLPKDVNKLKWMETVPDLPKDKSQFIIDDVSMIRFDFNGNLVPPTREIDNTIHSALHHHSIDPQLAGYTILELNRLAKSTFPSQRCIAIQTLGRILCKLGQQKYYQLVPEIDSETYKEDGSIQNVMNKIYSMFWDLIKSEDVILTLEVASNEQFTKNLSVRTYAIDALWLWKKGGGDFTVKDNKK